MISLIIFGILLALAPFLLEFLKSLGLVALVLIRIFCIYGLTFFLLILALKGN